ncbi:endolytic transglycosylase MltG [bacterium]|nr:endolytic transglycosylase MltG [bacterium]
MKKRKSTFSRLFLTVILIFVIFGGYIWHSIYTPIDEKDAQEISFIIKSGTSARNIAQGLKDNGLIRSTSSFYSYIRLTGEDKNITAGRFMLKKSMNIPEIIDTITVAAASESTVTVQEGLTIREIDDKLTAQGLILDGEFEAAVKDFNNYESYPFIDKNTVSSLEFPLEGYLYPDTYFVDGVEFDSNELITKMLGNFKTKFSDLQPLFDAQDRSLHEILTMASILQKEVRTPKDFNTVSGILWKRLDSGWHIGADATIIYVTGRQKITAEDLELDSPYNTRLHTGMPPGPISNPDKNHIKASITPEDSDYWYYLTTLDTGEVIYARTNDEQNVNKAKYLY